MKKRIISVIALLLMLSSMIYVGLKNNEKKSDEKNYIEAEIDGFTYLLKTGTYSGEYDTVDFTSKEYDFGTKGNGEVFTYEEYEKICKDYNLKQTYKDKNKNYILFCSTTLEKDNVSICNVEIEEETACVYFCEDFNNADITCGYFMSIPVDKTVTQSHVVLVYAKEPEPDIFYCDKPVIYLYPEKETKYNVSLEIQNGELTCTYPKYDNGWEIIAKPDGTIIKNNKEYNYLYWEATTKDLSDFSEGYCIKGEDTAEFLENILSELGLNRKEANEFIVYWLPLMENNNYNIISFNNEKYIKEAKLNIEPKVDTIIRIYMTWKPSEEKVEIKKPEIITPVRTGNVLVEWGGSKIK